MVEKLKLPDEDRVSGVSFLRQYDVNDTYPEHTHDDFYELSFVVGGTAIHHVNGSAYALETGSVVLIRPTDVHYYEALNSYELDLISIGFLISIFDEITAFMELSPGALTAPEYPPHFVLKSNEYISLADKIKALHEQTDPLERRRRLKSILSAILLDLIYVKEGTPIPQNFSDLITKMSEKENFVKGLPRLIELSGYTSEHITREFRKYLGVTPTEFINSKRLEYAVKLIEADNMSISDICFECGFGNLSHFNHLFKKTYNCSPREYAKNIIPCQSK